MEDTFNDWEITNGEIIEYELDDYTVIRYYVNEQKYVAEWIDKEDGEEYEVLITDPFVDTIINNIPFTVEEFDRFRGVVKDEINGKHNQTK